MFVCEVVSTLAYCGDLLSCGALCCRRTHTYTPTGGRAHTHLCMFAVQLVMMMRPPCMARSAFSALRKTAQAYMSCGCGCVLCSACVFLAACTPTTCYMCTLQMVLRISPTLIVRVMQVQVEATTHCSIVAASSEVAQSFGGDVHEPACVCHLVEKAVLE